MKIKKRDLSILIEKYLTNEASYHEYFDADLTIKDHFINYVDDDGKNFSDNVVNQLKSLIPAINKMIKKAKNSIKPEALKIAKERKIIRPGLLGLYDSFVVSQNIDKIPNPKIIIKKTFPIRNKGSNRDKHVYAYYTVSKARYLIYNLPEIKQQLEKMEVNSIQDIENLIEKKVTGYTGLSGNEFNSITLSAYMLYHEFDGKIPLSDDFKEKVINSTIIKEEIAHFVDYAIEDLLQSLSREKNKEKIYEISKDLKIKSKYNNNTFSKSYLKKINVDQIIDPQFKSDDLATKLMLYYQKYYNQFVNEDIDFFKAMIKNDPEASNYNISQFDKIKNNINSYINTEGGADELYAALSSVKNSYGKNLQKFLDISPHMIQGDKDKSKILAMRLMLTSDLSKLKSFMKNFKAIKYT